MTTQRSHPTSTAGIRSVELAATVTRRNPDGSVRAVEDLGTVAYWHRNPFKRLAARIRGAGRITPR